MDKEFMKTSALLLLLLLYSCSSDKSSNNFTTTTESDSVSNSNIEGNTSVESEHSEILTVFEGQGLNNLRLGTSNEIDLQEFRLPFVADSGESITCGDYSSCHTFWKRYQNEESGLLLEYASPCFPEHNLPKSYSQKLIQVTISGNNLATLNNGIRIGTSTYSDVVELYGPVSKDWKNEYYLPYEKLGITFLFDKDSKLSLIKVYSPYHESQRECGSRLFSIQRAFS